MRYRCMLFFLQGGDTEAVSRALLPVRGQKAVDRKNEIGNNSTDVHVRRYLKGNVKGSRC